MPEFMSAPAGADRSAARVRQSEVAVMLRIASSSAVAPRDEKSYDAAGGADSAGAKRAKSI
jgi:hypothetical protein